MSTGGDATAELGVRSNGDFNEEDAEGTEKSYIPSRLIVWAADGLEPSPGRALSAKCNEFLSGGAASLLILGSIDVAG